MSENDRGEVQAQWLAYGRSWGVDESTNLCEIAKLSGEDLTKLRLCLIILDELPESISWVGSAPRSEEKIEVDSEKLEYFMVKPPSLARALAGARKANQSSGLSKEHKSAGIELFMHLVKIKNQDKDRQLAPSPYLDIAIGDDQLLAINPDMFERTVSEIMKDSVGVNSLKMMSKRVLWRL
jgi:hypothetical protein